MSTQQEVHKAHLLPENTPIVRLEAKAAFEKLSKEEKLYAHYIGRACWSGSRVCLFQTSVESPIIFQMFLTLFNANTTEDLKQRALAGGVSEEEYRDFMQYVAVFYGNMGNYLSFGDSKFVPRISKDRFEAVLAHATNKAQVLDLWGQCGDLVYDLSPGVRELGLDGDGISTYYSPNVSRADIGMVQEFLDQERISPYNTRLWKIQDDKGEVFEVRIASAEVRPPVDHQFKGKTIRVTYGDHKEYMRAVADNLEQAAKYASNDNQRAMMQKYVAHFRGGNIEDHKDSQREWIKDIGPVVETNIGFIESYRDPYGVRGEFEGFVAMVNKDVSAKFSELVSNAPHFIARLPWPKEFEKDVFLRPDFTSLEVLTFASSGIPAGINIPNYDDIRQTQGFKNVSLGNVLSARKSEDRVTFLGEADSDLFNRTVKHAFEVQVGIHELLGHGSGKLFTEDADGKKNFSAEVINPLTNAPISSWYKPGETYDSKFQATASTMEECRAEACGIYLCTLPELLTVFGFPEQDREGHPRAADIIYINWLNMVRAGLLALEFYTPETRKWRQAHMQARYAILQVLLHAGSGFVAIHHPSDDDATITLDPKLIDTVGRPAIGSFLRYLMVYKATADVEQANAFYGKYTAVNEDFLKLRELVLKKKKPRNLFVQSHTRLTEDGQVELIDFEDSAEGMARSFRTRFGDGSSI